VHEEGGFGSLGGEGGRNRHILQTGANPKWAGEKGGRKTSEGQKKTDHWAPERPKVALNNGEDVPSLVGARKEGRFSVGQGLQ